MSIKPGYIRVSEILSQWDTFGKIDKEVLEKKAALGSAVHEAIKAEQSNIFVPLQDNEQGYFQSFLKWKEESKCVFIQNELRLYCEGLKITGCIDALVSFPKSSKLTLIDYKTSAAENGKMWRLQGGFYHYLAIKAGFNLDERMLFIKLDKNGNSPKIYEYFFSHDLLNMCMAAYTTFRYFNTR